MTTVTVTHTVLVDGEIDVKRDYKGYEINLNKDSEFYNKVKLITLDLYKYELQHANRDSNFIKNHRDGKWGWCTERNTPPIYKPYYLFSHNANPQRIKAGVYTVWKNNKNLWALCCTLKYFILPSRLKKKTKGRLRRIGDPFLPAYTLIRNFIKKNPKIDDFDRLYDMFLKIPIANLEKIGY